jgi:hypothetical protein
MNKLAWVFGNTSNFSQAIRFELESQNISTYGFGRDNTDYNDFDSFINGKVIPDIVILNANIEESIALQIDTQNYKDISVDEMSNMLTTYSPVFLFFVKLIKWLESRNEPVNICSISSSITSWPYKSNQYVMYAVLRSMLQQVVFSASNNVTTAFCVSPSGIDANNIKQYAKDLVLLVKKETDLALIDLGMEKIVIDLLKYKNE